MTFSEIAVDSFTAVSIGLWKILLGFVKVYAVIIVVSIIFHLVFWPIVWIRKKCVSEENEDDESVVVSPIPSAPVLPMIDSVTTLNDDDVLPSYADYPDQEGSAADIQKCDFRDSPQFIV